MDHDGQAILSRARAARDHSTRLQTNSRMLGRVAADLHEVGSSRQRARLQLASRRLIWESEAVDGGLSALSRFVDADARLVGRDPAIEQAKTLLCDHYKISRRDAFAILRRTSSNTNRKLRDVARALLDTGRFDTPI